MDQRTWEIVLIKLIKPNKLNQIKGWNNMNKQRRTEIANIVTELEILKERLDKVLSEEQDVFDNMPENLQYSMRGEESQEAIDNMDGAMSDLENAISQLEDIN